VYGMSSNIGITKSAIFGIDVNETFWKDMI